MQEDPVTKKNILSEIGECHEMKVPQDSSLVLYVFLRVDWQKDRMNKTCMCHPLL